MNWEKLGKNIGRIVELQPVACFLDNGGRQQPWVSDDWRIDKVHGERVELVNLRTNHRAIFAKDHIHHFTSDPNRSPDGSNYGFLVLQVQLFIHRDRISIRPCPRPGEPVPPPPIVEAPEMRVDDAKRLAPGHKSSMLDTDAPEMREEKATMANVYVEARPKGRPEGTRIDDYVVEDYSDHVLHTSSTQREAIDWAKRNGHRPLVARVRHRNDKRNPDHWRSAE